MRKAYFPQSSGQAKPPSSPTFEDFVDVSRLIVRRRNSTEQQAVVGRVLDSLLPPFAPIMFRVLFPFRQWSAELNAQITKAWQLFHHHQTPWRLSWHPIRPIHHLQPLSNSPAQPCMAIL